MEFQAGGISDNLYVLIWFHWSALWDLPDRIHGYSHSHLEGGGIKNLARVHFSYVGEVAGVFPKIWFNPDSLGGSLNNLSSQQIVWPRGGWCVQASHQGFTSFAFVILHPVFSISSCYFLLDIVYTTYCMLDTTQIWSWTESAVFKPHLNS